MPNNIRAGVHRDLGAVLGGDNVKSTPSRGNQRRIVDPSRQRGLASYKKPKTQGRLSFEGKGRCVLGGTDFVKNAHGLVRSNAQSQVQNRIGRLVFQLGQAGCQVMDQDAVGGNGQIDRDESNGIGRLIHGDLGSQRSGRKVQRNRNFAQSGAGLRCRKPEQGIRLGHDR